MDGWMDGWTDGRTDGRIYAKKKKNSGRRLSDETVERVRAAFLRSAQKSTDLTTMEFSFWDS
jgi:hypothetical protein